MDEMISEKIFVSIVTNRYQTLKSVKYSFLAFLSQGRERHRIFCVKVQASQLTFLEKIRKYLQIYYGKAKRFVDHIMIHVKKEGSQVLKVTVYQTSFPFIMLLQGSSSTIYLKQLRNISTIIYHQPSMCQNILCQGQECLAQDIS